MGDQNKSKDSKDIKQRIIKGENFTQQETSDLAQKPGDLARPELMHASLSSGNISYIKLLSNSLSDIEILELIRTTYLKYPNLFSDTQTFLEVCKLFSPNKILEMLLKRTTFDHSQFHQSYEMLAPQLPNSLDSDFIRSDLLTILIGKINKEEFKKILNLIGDKNWKNKKEQLTLDKMWHALSLAATPLHEDMVDNIRALIKVIGDVTPMVEDEPDCLKNGILYNYPQYLSTLMDNMDQTVLKRMIQNKLPKIIREAIQGGANNTVQLCFNQLSDQELVDFFQHPDKEILKTIITSDNVALLDTVIKRLGFEKFRGSLTDEVVDELSYASNCINYLSKTLKKEEVLSLITYQTELLALPVLRAMTQNVDAFRALTAHLDKEGMTKLLNTSFPGKEKLTVAHEICRAGNAHILPLILNKVSVSEMTEIFSSRNNTVGSPPILDAIQRQHSDFIQNFLNAIPPKFRVLFAKELELLEMRKRTAHTMGISDEAIDKNTDFLSILGERVLSSRLSLNWLTDLLDEYTQKVPAAQKERLTQITDTFAFTRDHWVDDSRQLAEDLHQRIQQGLPTMIPIFAESHSTTLIVWKNQLIMSNRGLGGHKEGRLVIFDLKSGHPTIDEIIPFLGEANVKGTEDAVETWSEVNQRIDDMRESNAVAKFSVGPQHHNTCTFVNKKSAVLAMFALQDLMEQGLANSASPNPEKINEVVTNAEDFYSDFATFVKAHDFSDMLQTRYLAYFKLESPTKEQTLDFNAAKDVLVNYLEQHKHAFSANKDDFSRHLKVMKQALPNLSMQEVEKIGEELSISARNHFIFFKEVLDLSAKMLDAGARPEDAENVEKYCFGLAKMKSVRDFFAKHDGPQSMLFSVLLNSTESDSFAMQQFIKHFPHCHDLAFIQKQDFQTFQKLAEEKNHVWLLNQCIQKAEPSALFDFIQQEHRTILQLIQKNNSETLDVILNKLEPAKVQSLFLGPNEQFPELMQAMLKSRNKNFIVPVLKAVAGQDIEKLGETLQLKLEGISVLAALLEKERISEVEALKSLMGSTAFNAIIKQSSECQEIIKSNFELRDLLPVELQQQRRMRTTRQPQDTDTPERPTGDKSDANIPDRDSADREARRAAREARKAARERIRRELD